MAGLPRLCARDLKRGRNEIPRCRLAQSFACGKPRKVALLLGQRHGIELEVLTEDPQ